MRPRRFSRAFAVVTVLGAAVAIAGCSGGSGSLGPGGNTASLVRGINALEGCPTNVDIEQLNFTPLSALVNLPYGVAPSSTYAAIRAGSGLHYGIFPTGTTTGALDTTDITLGPHDPQGDANSGTYTLAATGACNAPVGVAAPRLVRLQDSFPFRFAGPEAGSVGIRVINLIPDFNGGITLASNGAAVHGTDDAGTNNVEYAAKAGVSTSHYNSGLFLAGSPTLTIRTNANVPIATVPSFNFQPNHAYTLFVIGEVNPTAGAHGVTVVPAQDY